MTNTNEWVAYDNLDIVDSSADDDAEFDADKAAAESKINKVMAFIAANPAFSTRQVVEKFGLDWHLEKDLGNGIARVGFYTDESQRFMAFEVHDDMSKWFR